MHTAYPGITIIERPLLAERTTMHLGGPALAEVVVGDVTHIDKLPEILKSLGEHVMVMGEGSNILASDDPLPFVLLRAASTVDPVILGEEGGEVLVRAEAGLRLPGLLASLARMGLSGLEGLCGIPGAVGGAAAMNAGSYSKDMEQVLHSLLIFSPQLGLVELPASRFAFSYRSCTLTGHDGWFLIMSVTVRTHKDEAQRIKARMRGNYLKKQTTQPVTARSAGCVFKNPAPGVSAGKLMDTAGLKGLRRGGMIFSPIHANFLVHEHKGSFAAALEMIELARERVAAHSGYTLEREVRIWR